MENASSEIVIIAIILLSIAMVGGILTNYLKIPYASMLVLIGLAVGLFHIFPHLKITPAIIYYVFLPILIMEGAVKFKVKTLKENLLPISVYAIFGTIISTILSGLALHYVFRIPLKQSLLFGAIISPTDPLSIMALLKNNGSKSNKNGEGSENGGESGNKPGAREGIETVLEGESLFNDGISLVLYELFLTINFNKNPVFIIGISSLKFLYTFLGGAVLGIGLGFLISFILSFTYDYLAEIMISILLAYISIIAAYYIGVSFIITIIFSGIILANYGFKKMVSSQTIQVFPIVIEFMAFVLNSLIFLLIGMEMNLFKILNFWLVSGILIVFALFSRGFSIYILAPLINFIKQKFEIFSKGVAMNNIYKNFMIFGGLRGALSIAMALSLPLHLKMRSEIITYVFIIVLFSLTVQGIIFDIYAKKRINKFIS
ncbi:MAG: cation:proton antiporter [Deltaproteobacteria bacterium]|nr:cation:proton antiporter [Deltaproteobacteria bacterium]MCL5880682.1 cation:proton antiporter [Deltaproteobacteria bacterium]MDA8305193.1 cation:proton antiporter [Deltaproteobacteria bacterium]